MSGQHSIPDWICRRAGGRRGYNKRRKIAQTFRRSRVASLLLTNLSASQTQIAKALGVHRSTISRGVAWLYQEASRATCPVCGSTYLKEETT